LAQVLRRHGGNALHWKNRRFWPVLLESATSIFWGYSFVILTAIWITSYAVGYPPIGASPIPNWWGMMMATVCLAQLLTGVVLDRRYDVGLGRSYGVAVFYPLIYWMLLALVTFRSTPRGFFRRPERKVTRWQTRRD
jgi:biofilm PGA synthesis N-glycosyltransferase PgaC